MPRKTRKRNKAKSPAHASSKASKKLKAIRGKSVKAAHKKASLRIDSQQEILPKPTQIMLPVTASQEEMKGRYTNMAVINHTSREFMFDFFLTQENMNLLVSRLLTSPQHAKVFHEVLGANIEKYEKKHGVIKTE